MVDPQIVARIRRDADAMPPCADAAHRGGFASPLCAIETLAYAIGRKAPAVLPEASEIIALVTAVRSAGPSRDEIAEAIEEVCGDELGGGCVSRIAEAVMKLCRSR